MDRKSHWEEVYQGKAPTEVSWHQQSPQLSLKLIQSACPDHESRILDVGGGSSRLAVSLIDAGYKNLSVLDISSKALKYAQQEADASADKIQWIVSDVLQFKPAELFDLWHDRALFHFLTAEDDRKQYLKALKNALTPKGFVVIATFAIGGPERCSGLPIVQYDGAKLSKELGAEFKLLKQQNEMHLTPWGAEQNFFYGLFQRSATQ